MIHFKSLILCTTMGVLLCYHAHAATNQVPEDFDSIQSALDTSSPGDVIVVSPGVYTENLIFPGHDLTLRSTEPTSPTVVDATIIRSVEGSMLAVLNLSGSESPKTLVSGLTLTGARRLRGWSASPPYAGGGIAGNGSKATITYNNITDNEAESGGGLALCHGLIANNRITNNSTSEHYVGGGLAACDAEIRDNVITGNLAQYGGGLAVCYDAIIAGNVISNNRVGIRGRVLERNEAAKGGAIYFCKGLVENNLIEGNTANQIFFDEFRPEDSIYEVGEGGGIYVVEGTLRNNLIINNEAGLHGGGAAYLQRCDVYHNRFEGNVSYSEAGGIYNILACYFTNNIIVGNQAIRGESLSGEFDGSNGALLRVEDSYFANNLVILNRSDANSGGGGFLSSVVDNNVSWLNEGELGGFNQFGGTAHNNIIMGWSGKPEIAIDVDPQFVDFENGDYRLKPTSPLIDAGVIRSELPDVDYDGFTRIVKSLPLDTTMGDGSGIDIGPFEFQDSLGFTETESLERILLGIWKGAIPGYDPNNDALIDVGDLRRIIR